MKRKLSIIILFVLVLAVSMSLSIMASEANDGGIREYVEEKIVPVIMGVATAIIALLGTLKSIFKALAQIKESKSSLDEMQRRIEKSNKSDLDAIKKKYEEIKEAVRDVPQLNDYARGLGEQIDTLSREIANLSKIASLGFGESKEHVKDGRAREITLISNKNRELIENEVV